MARRCQGLVWILLITISLSPLPLSTAVAQEQQPHPLSGAAYLQPYILYNTFYTDLSIQALAMASIPGRNIVAASGFDNASGIYSMEILSIDASSRSVNRSKYALSGAPITTVADGDYGGYIAVGTDRGEVVIYNAQEGRASYMQASRYSVKKLSIGVGGSGDPYLAVLDDAGFLYLYRATRGGWAEIGPYGSTAVYSYTRAGVRDISGTEVVAGGQRRVDPSLLLALYEPVRVNISFSIYNETGFPISGAVITARLVKPVAQIDLVFQAATDQSGSASLHLPLLDPEGTIYSANITHPSYETVRIDIALDRNVVGKGLSYIIIMRSGAGVTVPLVENPPVYFASLLDATGAPESIRFGKPLLLTVEPSYVKLIRPSVAGVPWTYIGVIVGCCREGQAVVVFTYFDQDLDPVFVGRDGYVWYVLPGAVDRVWVGYDDSGRGVSVMLGGGRVYYFLYNQQRGFHLAFWSLDIPGPVVSADYRNGVLISIDGSGMLHIHRTDPERSVECTRSGDYLGIPVGPGVGSLVGPVSGYLAVSSRIYIVYSLQNIAFNRCSIELVRLYPRVIVSDIISNRSLSIGDGYIYIYEDSSLVAGSPIANGSSVFYLPRGSYTARVLSSFIEYSRGFEVRGSLVDLPGPVLYRVIMSLYYYSPESPYVATLSRVPPGLILSIDNRINITTTETPIELLIEGGSHTATLIGGGIELARSSFTVNRSGSLNLVLRAETAIINISVGVLESRSQVIPMGSITLRLFAEGPLLRGDLGVIEPGSPVVLPLGIYRIAVTSPFFYDEELLVGVTKPGSLEDLEILLRPREIQARLLVVDEFGAPVPNVSVSLIERASGTTVFSGVASDDGELIIPKVFLGDYLISVEPLNKSLYVGYTGPLRIDRQDLVVSINRTSYNFSISLVDPISGSIVSPVRVLIYMGDRLMFSTDISGLGVISNISLPHGQARIVVEPSGQVAIYNRIEADATIPVGGGETSITLTRRNLDLSLTVVDDINQPVQGASVTIRSIENPVIEITQTTDSEGKAALRIPYGSYEAIVDAPGYNRLETQIPVGEQSIVIKLQPTLLNLLSRYTIAYIAIGMVAAIIIISRLARRYIEKKASEEAL